MRFPLPPAKPKVKRRRPRRTGPEPCGALHPDRPGVVDDATGEQLVDAVYCTGRVRYDLDEKGRSVRIEHRGKHRARLLKGVVVRWP